MSEETAKETPTVPPPEAGPENPLTAEPVKPEELANEISGGMSEATHTPKPAADSPRQEGEAFFDKAGTRFDPEIHRANPLTGTPELNGEGLFKSKRGRKSREEAYRPKVDPVSGAAVPPDEYDQQADFWLGSAYAILCASISPAWKPGGLADPKLTPEQQKEEAKAEHETVRYPLAAYLREKRFKELKPWQMLTLAAVSFGFRRYQNDDVTREKFNAISEKVRAKIFGAKNDPSLNR